MSVRTMARISKHTMLGPGGQLRVPKSESAELERVIELAGQLRSELFDGNMTQAESLLARIVIIAERLKDQVSQGYHRNPARFKAGTVVGQIGKDVHDIRYKHAEDGRHYEHEFGGEVEVYAVERNGKRDLLLTHRRGEPLWDDF